MAASDPAVAVDLEGRAFYANIIFDRFAGFGGAVVVALSPQGAGGSFYNDSRRSAGNTWSRRTTARRSPLTRSS